MWRHDQRMSYRERPTTVPGTVLWQRTVGQVPELTRILPDGCMDLLWDGRRLSVAGPDATARQHRSRAGEGRRRYLDVATVQPCGSAVSIMCPAAMLVPFMSHVAILPFWFCRTTSV